MASPEDSSVLLTRLSLMLHPVVYVTIILVLLNYFFISPALSSRFLTFYSKLSNAKRAKWNSLPSSTIHATIVTILGLIVLIREQDKPTVHLKSELGIFTLRISSGYFIGDIVIMIILRDFPHIFHHILSGAACILTLIFSCCMKLTLQRLISEMSTPFKNLLWAVKISQTPKNSPLLFFTAIGMTSSFYLCRIIIIPWLWYTLVKNVFIEMDQGNANDYVTPLPLNIMAFCISLFLDIFNVIWGYKVTRGMAKVFKDYKHKKVL